MSLLAFYRSTVGKKVIMAVTGLIGIGFLILHVAGNLEAFEGQSKLNSYSAMLHGPLSEALWALRVVLLAAVILHVTMAYQLTRRTAAARPIAYQQRTPQVSTLAARTMKWGGVLLLVFIVFHILHFTTETFDPGHAGGMVDIHGDHDVYGNIVASFHVWWVAAFYIVAMMALGLHLFHGAWSSIRTLGYARPSENPLHRRLALIIAVAIWLGFTALPVGVIAGVIH